MWTNAARPFSCAERPAPRARAVASSGWPRVDASCRRSVWVLAPTPRGGTLTTRRNAASSAGFTISRR